MPTISLPDDPSLNRLRRLARILHRKVRAGDSESLAVVAAHYPDGVPEDLATFQLSAAQLVVARRCGFASWPRLKRYLEVVAEHSWNSSPPGGPAADVADEFCRLACLAYDDDGPERWAQARQLLAEQPELTAGNIWAAAAAAQPDRVARLLEQDRARARQRGSAADLIGGGRCSTSSTRGSTRTSRSTRCSRSRRCCSAPARIPTRDTCGTRCQPPSRC